MDIFSRLKYNGLVTPMSYTTLSRVSIPALSFQKYNHYPKPGAMPGFLFLNSVNARLKRGAPLRLRPAHAGLAAHCVTQVVRYSGGGER